MTWFRLHSITTFAFQPSFRHCVRVADCTSQARSTWNSSGGCPYPASPAETAPRQLQQAAPVAPPQALTPLSPILKSPLFPRRNANPTDPSVRIATTVLVIRQTTENFSLDDCNVDATFTNRQRQSTRWRTNESVERLGGAGRPVHR